MKAVGKLPVESERLIILVITARRKDRCTDVYEVLTISLFFTQARESGWPATIVAACRIFPKVDHYGLL